MVAITLAYNDAAGSEGLAELSAKDGCSTFFLPDNPSAGGISLSPHTDKEHSYLCLEVRPGLALLRTFNDSHGPCSIVGEDQTNFVLPVSAASHFISFILRPGDHFLAPSGRWFVRWDEDGKTSESMRPPMLPLVAEGDETTDTYPATLEEIVDEHPTSPSVLSEASCSFTRSPVKGEECHRDGADCGEQQHSSCEEPAEPSTSREIVEAVEASPDKRNPVAQPGFVEENIANESRSMSNKAHSVAESECGPEVVDVAVDMSDVPSFDGVQKIPAPFENSQSAADVAQTATEPHDYCDVSTPSTPDEPRGSKRKFDEIEGAGSDHSTTDAESNLSIDAGPVDTIVVNRKPTKSYSSKDGSYIAKTPTRQTRRRQPSTPTTALHSLHSPVPSDQPPAKRRSDRRQGTPSTARHGGTTPVVIFSSATTVDQGKTTMDKTAMRTFRKLGGKVTEAILEATILCVPTGPLKKTSKLVMAVALGMDIVTEQWIAETHRLGRFPATSNYLPVDRPSEQEWDTSLKEAIARGKNGLTHLLSGVTVFFTKKLRTDLGKLERDFSQIATRLGAERVERRLPSLKDDDKPAGSEVLIIGGQDDPQGRLVRRLGYTLFNKDILVMAVLRGRLGRECEEFVMEVPIKAEDETWETSNTTRTVE